MPSTAESRRRREPLNSCSRTKAERQVYSLWTGYRRKLTLAVHRLKHPYPCASRTSPSAGQPRPPLCSGIAHGTNPPRALSQNGDLYTESGQTLPGSFSAVSTPIFASKYALESSRRDLQNALLCTVLMGSIWLKKYAKINIEKMKSGKSRNAAAMHMKHEK